LPANLNDPNGLPVDPDALPANPADPADPADPNDLPVDSNTIPQ